MPPLIAMSPPMEIPMNPMQFDMHFTNLHQFVIVQILRSMKRKFRKQLSDLKTALFISYLAAVSIFGLFTYGFYSVKNEKTASPTLNSSDNSTDDDDDFIWRVSNVVALVTNITFCGIVKYMFLRNSGRIPLTRGAERARLVRQNQYWIGGIMIGYVGLFCSFSTVNVINFNQDVNSDLFFKAIAFCLVIFVVSTVRYCVWNRITLDDHQMDAA